MDYKYIDSILQEYSTWSGGELNIRLKDNIKYSDEINLVARIQNSEDLMKLILVSSVLRKKGKKVDVFIPYLPYARQDRICNRGEPFSLKVFADLINQCEFNSVRSFDVHSNVAELLINNFKSISNYLFIETVIGEKYYSNKNIVIVSPDAGAFKKGSELVDRLAKYYNHKNIEHLPCLKVRDANSGTIDKIYVGSDSLDSTKEYIIVDDICDGGRTFVHLANALKEKGAKEISLIVSHGIFSFGTKHIVDAGIKTIYSTNSFISDNKDIPPWFEVTQYI